MRAVGEVGALSRPYLARLPLDHTGLPGCSDACVEESLKVGQHPLFPCGRRLHSKGSIDVSEPGLCVTYLADLVSPAGWPCTRAKVPLCPGPAGHAGRQLHSRQRPHGWHHRLSQPPRGASSGAGPEQYARALVGHRAGHALPDGQGRRQRETQMVCSAARSCPADAACARAGPADWTRSQMEAVLCPPVCSAPELPPPRPQDLPPCEHVLPTLTVGLLSREAQQQELSGYVTLADATLVGLQAIKAAHGAQSPQAQAAWRLQAAAMEQARQAFLSAHDDKCAHADCPGMRS